MSRFMREKVIINNKLIIINNSQHGNFSHEF